MKTKMVMLAIALIVLGVVLPVHQAAADPPPSTVSFCIDQFPPNQNAVGYRFQDWLSFTLAQGTIVATLPPVHDLTTTQGCATAYYRDYAYISLFNSNFTYNYLWTVSACCASYHFACDSTHCWVK